MREELVPILNELKTYGYELDEFILDGEWHSFKVDPGNNKKSGSYLAEVSPDRIKVVVKDFRDAESKIFNVAIKPLDPDEALAFKKKEKDEREKKERKERMKMETKANELWALFEIARENPKHPYLVKKGLKGTYGTRCSPLGNLYVPMRDIDGKFWGFESIDKDGDKKSESKKNGKFHLIGEVKENSTFFLCEGFATAATVFEITLQPSVCCFGGSNLKAVALLFRARYPKLSMIIAGDAGTAGMKYAKQAAFAGKAQYLIPEFQHIHPNLTDWNDLREFEGEGTVRMQLEDRERALDPKNEKQSYIQKWLETRDVKVGYSGQIKIMGKEADPVLIENQIFLDGMNDQQVIPERLLRAYLENWIESERLQELERVMAPLLIHAPNNELERFVSTLVQNPDEKDFAVMKHFIWQVKRKMKGLAIEHHMMPVFTGKSGAGKTQALRKLISPFEDLRCESDLHIFSDSREFRLFKDFFIIYMDEMQAAAKADLAAVKRIISSDRLTYRKLGSNYQLSIPVNTTFIGSSNERLVSLIKDPHSSRRFYELRCHDVADWETINSIDYLKIWQSISENETCPVSDKLFEIRERQEESKFTTDVEDWIKESICQIDTSGNFLSSQYLFEQYCTFCERGNRFKVSIKFFSHEMERLGFRKFRNAKQRGFCVLLLGNTY